MRNVYFNHDGSVDDLVSLLLLLQMSDVHLTGVGVVGADFYLEPALAATRKVIDRFGHDTHLEVAASDSRGVHPFPKEWRLDAFSLDALPILNESGTMVTPVAPKPALLSGMLIGTRRPLRLSGIVTSLSKWLDLKALVKSH